MMKKIISASVFIIIIITSLRFWIGIYRHDEFNNTHLFLKHRPIWKWKFYSPTGMSDLKINEMTPAQQQEQRLFNEFVKNRGLSR